MTDVQDNAPPVAEDKIEGADAIAAYLRWKPRRVYQAREQGWCAPIRRRRGMGLYAFKSELDAWLKAEDTLAPRKDDAA